ncbi:MAG: hypothetical protein RLZZ504_155, partial [Bacteroidota bacterium]
MLISGLDGHICDQCADQAQKIVEKELGMGGNTSGKDSGNSNFESTQESGNK